MSDISSRKQMFYKKYEISVQDESKRVARYFRPTEYFIDPLDKDYCEESCRMESEPLVTLNIPLSKLNHIIDLEALFYNNIEDVSRRRIFEVWYEQQMEEKRLRQQYPTVQAAYEAYSLVLTLCSTKPKVIKDL